MERDIFIMCPPLFIRPMSTDAGWHEGDQLASQNAQPQGAFQLLLGEQMGIEELEAMILLANQIEDLGGSGGSAAFMLHMNKPSSSCVCCEAPQERTETARRFASNGIRRQTALKRSCHRCSAI